MKRPGRSSGTTPIPRRAIPLKRLIKLENYEVYNLDCSQKQNRKILLKEVMAILHKDEKPTKSELERYSAILYNKYKMKIHLVKQIGDHLFISVLHPNDGYVTFETNSYYEALCKLIILIRNYSKYKKLKVK